MLVLHARSAGEQHKSLRCQAVTTTACTARRTSARPRALVPVSLGAGRRQVKRRGAARADGAACEAGSAKRRENEAESAADRGRHGDRCACWRRRDARTMRCASEVRTERKMVASSLRAGRSRPTLGPHHLRGPTRGHAVTGVKDCLRTPSIRRSLRRGPEDGPMLPAEMSNQDGSASGTMLSASLRSLLCRSGSPSIRPDFSRRAV